MFAATKGNIMHFCRVDLDSLIENYHIYSDTEKERDIVRAYSRVHYVYANVYKANQRSHGSESHTMYLKLLKII